MSLSENPISITETTGCAIDVFIAGSRYAATEALREFCLRGECVTVSEADYVYTGGLEAGVRVGLIWTTPGSRASPMSYGIEPWKSGAS